MPGPLNVARFPFGRRTDIDKAVVIAGNLLLERLSGYPPQVPKGVAGFLPGRNAPVQITHNIVVANPVEVG